MAWLARFWNVVRPARIQRDLERELAFHLTERAEELREGGMSEAAAARAARLQFGNFTTQVERTRDMDIHDWLESTVRNVRYALRGMAKTPAFTATVILTLALAIGANSAVFSAIYAVLLRPLPFPNGDQLVKLAQAHPKVPQPFVAPVRLEDWNRLNDSLQAITGYYSEDVSELSAEIPEKLERVWVAILVDVDKDEVATSARKRSDLADQTPYWSVTAYGGAASTATQAQSARRCASAQRRGPSSVSCRLRSGFPTATRTFGLPVRSMPLLRRAGN